MNSRPGVSAGPPFSGFVHLIFALVTTSIGWIIIGTGLFAGGFIWGLNSHQVSYVAGGQGVYDVYSAPGFYYLHQENTSNDYVIKSLDFSPNLVGVLDGFGGTANLPTLLPSTTSVNMAKLFTYLHQSQELLYRNCTAEPTIHYGKTDIEYHVKRPEKNIPNDNGQYGRRKSHPPSILPLNML